MALTAAEWALIPTKSDSASLDGLVRVAELFAAVRATSNPELRLVGVVLFGVGASAKRIAQAARDAVAETSATLPWCSTHASATSKARRSTPETSAGGPRDRG